MEYIDEAIMQQKERKAKIEHARTVFADSPRKVLAYQTILVPNLKHIY